jgi:N-acetylglucosaminyldiphosphoundecaprenol N-acetyl-beta-D-mannosaminyltransferase
MVARLLLRSARPLFIASEEPYGGVPVSERIPVNYHLLGINIEATTKSGLLRTINDIVESDVNNCIIGNHNLHSLYLFYQNGEMRRFYAQSRHTHIDGMSLIILGKILGMPLKRQNRTGYLDWFEDFLHMAEEKSWRVYFLGGRREVAERVPSHFQAIYPRLQIKAHHGYDAFSNETTVYEEIKKFAPNILLVGMGMPLQEKWILQALHKVQVNVLLPCGAIMDYHVGAQKPAPRWIGQIGMEWLYRLAHRPRTLFFRYLIEPLLLAVILMKYQVTKRGYDEK